MSVAERPDPEHAWRFAQKLLGEDELDRLDALSDEEKLAELRAEGRDASWAPTAESLLAGIEEAKRLSAPPATRGSRVVTLARPRKMSPILWVAAASVVALGALAAMERSAIVARRARDQPAPIQAVPSGETPPPPTPQDLATKLLDEADTACGEGQYGLCNDKINEAVQVGLTAGEAPRVQRLRAYVHDHTTVPPN